MSAWASFDAALKAACDRAWAEYVPGEYGPRGPRPEIDYSSWRSYAESVDRQAVFDWSELAAEIWELRAELEELRAATPKKETP